MRYNTILFDLDGTLTDPKLGITRSVQHALNKFNIDVPNLDDLEAFIGPPLRESFAQFYGFDDSQCQNAILYFREYFAVHGLYENEVYPGISSLLENLKRQGTTVCLATSKPTKFAEQILEYFSLANYFDVVVGSEMNGVRDTKTEVIQHVLQVGHFLPSDCVMIGDRKHDVIGAKNTQMDSIAVAYGYGAMDELSAAKPTRIVKTVDELRSLLLA